MNDRVLFDVTKTTEAKCIACGATREPGEPRAALCLHDRDTAEYGIHSRRPVKCLNTFDPTADPFPEGY